MEWIKDYWWIVLVILAGILISGIKELSRVDVKKYLADKPEIPPHRDNNAEWDDEDDWPKKK
ncbi:YpfN family protein [Rouxiella sp. Mn2063]|uniref:YpfN family protein n=1 Tax=Rouxiella sp. Mn2063 TaxID=3395262 RepID=UPI003BBCE5F6